MYSVLGQEGLTGGNGEARRAGGLEGRRQKQQQRRKPAEGRRTAGRKEDGSVSEAKAGKKRWREDGRKEDKSS